MKAMSGLPDENGLKISVTLLIDRLLRHKIKRVLTRGLYRYLTVHVFLMRISVLRHIADIPNYYLLSLLRFII